MVSEENFLKNTDIEVLAKIAIEILSQKLTKTMSNFKNTNDIKYKNEYFTLLNDREKILNFNQETILKYCNN